MAASRSTGSCSSTSTQISSASPEVKSCFS
uniref:Uncharacterized protein n=1 Tax=Arundo donax TaxID=35708 RepID=A0A0A8Y554_ARUDO